MSYLSVVPGQPHHTGRTASSEVRTAHPRQLYTLHLPRDSNPPTLPTKKKREGAGLGCSSCHRAADAEAMNKQDAPFLDLSERSSKFGFSASGIGGLLASLGLCTLGTPACGWIEKFLPWRHGAAEPRRKPCLCLALHRSPGPLCRSRAWWVAAPRVEWWASSASLLRYSFYGPLRAPVQRPWELALLPVGGDETVKPEPRKPSMCHLPRSSAPGRLEVIFAF